MTRTHIVSLDKTDTRPRIGKAADPVSIMAQLLEPERALKEGRFLLQRVQRLNPLTTGGTEYRHMRLRDEPKEARRLALEQREALPPPEEVYPMGTAVFRAAYALPSSPERQETVTALVGQMLAAIPNTKSVSDKDIYLRSMVHDIMDEGYTSPVVAAACQNIRRTMTFAPSIAEVLAACKDRQEAYERTGNFQFRQIEQKFSEIHFVLHVTGGDDCEIDNLRRTSRYGHDPEAEAEDEAQWLHFRNQATALVPQIESRPIAPMAIDTVSDRAEVKPDWE